MQTNPLVALQDKNGGVQTDNYATLATSCHHDRQLKSMGKFQHAPMGTFGRAQTTVSGEGIVRLWL